MAVRGSGIGASYQGFMSLGAPPQPPPASGPSSSGGTAVGSGSMAAMYGTSSSPSGWSTQEPTIWLVLLVLLEAAALLGLRVSLRAHHGG